MVNLVRLLLVGVFLFSVTAEAEDVRALAERLEAKAMNGDARAAYNLGLLFSDGKKASPDLYTAIEWYERAARQGYAKAMLKLGDIYRNDATDHLNIEQAKYWYEKAVKKGSRNAMAWLGQLYALEEDYKKASFWIEKAAVKGHPEAMVELGRYYFEGKGVRFDLRRSFAWLELAIEKGEYDARSLQRKILSNKGQAWADDMRRSINDRMIPISYWNAR